MMDHIVHVGFHKTGSTWLQRHVFHKVDGAVSTIGNDLVSALIHNLVHDERFLEETFRVLLDELGRVLISSENLIDSPWGGGAPARRAERLATVMPDAKILIVRRDYEAMMRSLYAQYVNEGGYLSPTNFKNSVLSDTYMDFDAGVSRFQRLFDHVLVLPYQRLCFDPERFVRDIEGFAEVQFSRPLSDKRPNPSLRGWRLSLLRHWNRLFRISDLNPDPWVSVPYAHMVRHILQRTLPH